MRQRLSPHCPYCAQAAKFLESSAQVNNGHNHGAVWVCFPCGAWVGVHQGGRIPLGRLANKELRLAKQAAHAAFDPIWEDRQQREKCSRKQARGAAYTWLSKQLGLTASETYIGNFTVELCRRTVEVCRSVQQKRMAA